MDRTTYQVNEIFYSVQGEGRWTGVPATFIRLQGCPVGCPWCDSKLTWHAGGTKMELEEIIAQVQSTHIVITGGEPTLYNLDALILELRNVTNGRAYIQLETSGMNALKGNLTPDWITWSPKANLDFKTPMELGILVDEIKFVVDDAFTSDIVDAVVQHIKGFDSHPMLSVMTFMPEGCPPTELQIQKAIAMAQEFNGWPAHVMVSDRLQYRASVK